MTLRPDTDNTGRAIDSTSINAPEEPETHGNDNEHSQSYEDSKGSSLADRQKEGDRDHENSESVRDELDEKPDESFISDKQDESLRSGVDDHYRSGETDYSDANRQDGSMGSGSRSGESYFSGSQEDEGSRSFRSDYSGSQGSYQDEEGSKSFRSDYSGSQGEEGSRSDYSGSQGSKSARSDYSGSQRSFEDEESNSRQEDTEPEESMHINQVFNEIAPEGDTSQTESPRSAKSQSVKSEPEESLKITQVFSEITPDADQSQTESSKADSPRSTKSQSVRSEAEESMKIGEVFGQPNELFEDKKKGKEEEDSSRSKSSEGSKEVTDVSDREAEEESITLDTIDETKAAEKVTERADKESNQSPESPVKLDKNEKKRKKKKRKKRRKEAKSPALLDFAANVNDAMMDLEEQEEAGEQITETSAHRLLHGFDALLGIFLQLSDELELISTFNKSKKKKDKETTVHVQALQAVLSFADTFDQLFDDLKPIILDCFEEEPDEEMDEILYRLNSLVDLLCEVTDKVGEKQEWNERTETTYITLLELMERDALDLRCYFDDVTTPDQGLSANIHEAWSATGHIEELRALQYADDPWLFRQICYEVMVSTDQWCPDTSILMEICGIDPEMLVSFLSRVALSCVYLELYESSSFVPYFQHHHHVLFLRRKSLMMNISVYQKKNWHLFHKPRNMCWTKSTAILFHALLSFQAF